MVSQARHPAAPIDTAALARSLQAFGASLIPGGTFVLDRALKREMESLPEAARTE